MQNRLRKVKEWLIHVLQASSSLYCGLSPCVLTYCRLSSKPKTKGMLQLICFCVSTCISIIMYYIFQLLSHVQLFVTQWTAEHQASLSFTISQSLLRLMSIESVMPSNHHPLSSPSPSIFPSIMVFPMSQFFTSGGQSIGASASASIFPMNIQN